jgi:hypothetical protein
MRATPAACVAACPSGCLKAEEIIIGDVVEHTTSQIQGDADELCNYRQQRGGHRGIETIRRIRRTIIMISKDTSFFPLSAALDGFGTALMQEANFLPDDWQAHEVICGAHGHDRC